MGLRIILEDENGHAIQTLLMELNTDEFKGVNLDSFILLKYLDFNGDTTFNTLQSTDLIRDFEDLQAVTANCSNIIQQIIDLIKRVQKENHTYIKFCGD